jgi:hypothetical protein
MRRGFAALGNLRTPGESAALPTVVTRRYASSVTEILPRTVGAGMPSLRNCKR